MLDVRSNKRVAKNTVILYGRMIITMFIGMWTSRIVLNALGFTDQGLYNAVGGFVGLSALVTSSISGSISRFITFEIGRGDLEKVNRAVQNAITVQWVLAAIVVLLGETVGLWFLNNKMVIPADRLLAVNVVYQLSIANIVVGLVSSAPNALIMAYEKMNVYAGVAITNAVGLFGVGLAIKYYGGDRLIFYAILQFILAFGVRIFYAIYVRCKFQYLKLRFGFDKEIFVPIFSFAGWNGIGTSAAILRSSGTSVLLNIFGGPIANTINGIANSVNNLATMFVSDFTTAFTPQITKRYAAGEYQSLVPFLHQCSKFSYSLLLVMAVPVFLNAEPLLVLWLKKIPEGTIIFARLIIVFSLIECICRPLIAAKNATGQIRNYQLIVGGILLLTLPIAYIFLKVGLPIYYTYVAFIITSLGAFVARMVMLQGAIPLWSTRDFLFRSVSRCIAATAVGFALPVFIHLYMPDTIWYALAQCAIGFMWTCACVYLIAFNKQEKEAIGRMLTAALSKFRR